MMPWAHNCCGSYIFRFIKAIKLSVSRIVRIGHITHWSYIVNLRVWNMTSITYRYPRLGHNELWTLLLPQNLTYFFLYIVKSIQYDVFELIIIVLYLSNALLVIPEIYLVLFVFIKWLLHIQNLLWIYWTCRFGNDFGWVFIVRKWTTKLTLL